MPTEEHVRLDGKLFIVSFDDEGQPKAIKQRKVYAPGKPWSSLYNAPYWHHSMNLDGPKTRPRRIIEQAHLQRAQETT